MAVTFDLEKNAKNASAGWPERVAELEWDTAVIAEDPGATCGGSAAGIYWRKGDAGADAPQPRQTAEGGQEGQPDSVA